MSDKVYDPPKGSTNPHIKNLDQYALMYKQSIEDPKAFFGKEAITNLSWSEPFTGIHNDEFQESKWFEGGKLNIAFNCIDRHLSDMLTKLPSYGREMSQINQKRYHILICTKTCVNSLIF